MKTLFLLGDSTCAIKTDSSRPETGWGECFTPYLAPGFTLANYAMNGRSTQMCLLEGTYYDVYFAAQKGDYVIMQYGHNENKMEDYRHTDPFTTYQENLRFMAQPLLRKGIAVIFVSSIARARFASDGSLPDTHGDYPSAMEAEAARLGIPFVEMSERTRVYFEILGESRTLEYFMCFGPGIYPHYPQGKQDRTHLRPQGAETIAKMIYEAMADKGIACVKNR